MISHAALPGVELQGRTAARSCASQREKACLRRRRSGLRPAKWKMMTVHRHAELFYLQKQIQSQTPMVIVLADGERVEGCIEWYDRHALKVRGREKTLIYKSAIKYMYKLGEAGQ